MALNSIFGSQQEYGGIPVSHELSLEKLDTFIATKLTEIEFSEKVEESNMETNGRDGPEVVQLDIRTSSGTSIISADRLGVTSHSNFSTVRANVSVTSGKWLYEVLLGSKGVMQIGWCTGSCTFSQQIGIGDTPNSYAYDGNRVLKWNDGKETKYGTMWMTGDIVTCAIDCDNGNVSFYRNGVDLGVANSDLSVGSEWSYHPAVSLSLTENVRLNFGASPIRYPLTGYQLLQSAPTRDVAKANLLCGYLRNLVNYQHQHHQRIKSKWNNVETKCDKHKNGAIPKTTKASTDVIPGINKCTSLRNKEQDAGLSFNRFRDSLSVGGNSPCQQKVLSNMETAENHLNTVTDDSPHNIVTDNDYANMVTGLTVATSQSNLNHVDNKSFIFSASSSNVDDNNGKVDDSNIDISKLTITDDHNVDKTSEQTALELENCDACNIVDSHDADWLFQVSGHILEKLAPLLQSLYVVEECFLQMCILDQCGVEQWIEPQFKLQCLLDCICKYYSQLLPADFEKLMTNLNVSMVRKYRYSIVEAGYVQQKHLLAAMLEILQHDTCRKFVVEKVLFESGKFAMWMHIRPPEEELLEKYVPVIWWEEASLAGSTSSSTASQAQTLLTEEEESKRQQYESGCEKLGSELHDLELMQCYMLRLLLREDDTYIEGCWWASAKRKTSKSSREWFVERFRTFVSDYAYKLGFCEYPWPVALCFIHRLIQTLRYFSSGDNNVENLSVTLSDLSGINITPANFYNDQVNFYDVTRVGGVKSHMMKEFKDELDKISKSASNTTREEEEEEEMVQNIQSGMEENVPLREEKDSIHSSPLNAVSTGSSSLPHSLQELLDGVIWLYTLSAHKQFVKMANIQDALNEYKRALRDMKQKLAEDPPQTGTDDERKELTASILDLTENIDKQARQMAWLIGVVMTQNKRDDIFWLHCVLLKTVEECWGIGSLFAFLPEYYIFAVLQTYIAVKKYFHPTVPYETITDHEASSHRYAVLLGNLFGDNRILNITCKSLIMDALSSFVGDAESVKILENLHPLNRIKLVQTLLIPYEGRAWVRSNWILLQFWRGSGFAYRYKTAPHLTRKNVEIIEFIGGSVNEPCPSTIFQCHVGEHLHNRPEGASVFVDNLLNQLNWAFSEFMGMMQELQALSVRVNSVIIDTRQMAMASSCFEVSVALLRVLEMIVSVVPQVFLDFSRPSAELLLCRLCQCIGQMLSRVTSKSSIFEGLARAGIPGLEIVDSFPLLSGLAAIILQLVFKNEKNIWRKRATVALLAEPSLDLDCLSSLVAKSDKVKPDSEDGASTKTDEDKAQENSLDKPGIKLPEEREALSTAGSTSHDENQSNSTASSIRNDENHSYSTASSSSNDENQTYSTSDSISNDENQASSTSDSTNNDEKQADSTDSEKLTDRLSRISFVNYSEVSPAELADLESAINHLLCSRLKLVLRPDSYDEESVCKICYAHVEAVTFTPCGHTSCRACIAQHMMSHNNCFFCTAKVEDVKDILCCIATEGGEKGEKEGREEVSGHEEG